MAKLDLFVVDDNSIHDDIVNYVEQTLDETLYDGDERTIFMEVLTGWTVQFLVKLNELFNQRFAQYAKGINLDAHGENESCERLPKTKAHTTERFEISTTLNFNVVIPKGTRVTGDNEKYFATEEVGVIPAGNTYVDITVYAENGGVGYNGYKTGQLNNLVDKVAYVSNVSNLDETIGGDNGEPYPDEDGGIGDSHYYERIRLAKSSKTTAGAESLYEYYAKSADPSISDVLVESNQEAGTINLIVCCEDGVKPSEEIINKVKTVCNAKKVRPLGDKVVVSGISQINYEIELVYYTSEDEESDTIEEVEGTDGAIERYNTWQSSQIGKAINPDRLRAEILKSDTKTVGADYVEITKPAYTPLSSGQVAKWSGKMTVTHKTTAPATTTTEGDN